jgi:predicted nuclease of predicted toxin-antitoxin system
MKALVDMNLAPHWAELLSLRGLEAVHWSAIGSPKAIDTEIMSYARDNGYAVLTRDLDFSAILASTGGTSPSVIQIRTADARPETIFEPVFRALSGLIDEIEKGAIVTIDMYKVRLHILPLNN